MCLAMLCLLHAVPDEALPLVLNPMPLPTAPAHDGWQPHLNSAPAIPQPANVVSGLSISQLQQVLPASPNQVRHQLGRWVQEDAACTYQHARMSVAVQMTMQQAAWERLSEAQGSAIRIRVQAACTARAISILSCKACRLKSAKAAAA